jgi:hypothetical protein
MRLHILEKSSLKKPFLVGGAIVGLVISGSYLYRSLAHQGEAGFIPDPIWTRFVNVVLVMFVAIYIANLLRRLVELISHKGRQN